MYFFYANKKSHYSHFRLNFLQDSVPFSEFENIVVKEETLQMILQKEKESQETIMNNYTLAK